MSIPGFTAEASIGPTTQVYRAQNQYVAATVSAMYPQLNGGDIGEESAMDMAEQVVEDEMGTGLADEGTMAMDESAMAMMEHVTPVDNDEVHIDV